jgi:hypothetical protein
MNLAEYAQINTRWLWELEAALAAWQDGKRQSGDVRRQVAEQTAPLRAVP